MACFISSMVVCSLSVAFVSFVLTSFLHRVAYCTASLTVTARSGSKRRSGITNSSVVGCHLLLSFFAFSPSVSFLIRLFVVSVPWSSSAVLAVFGDCCVLRHCVGIFSTFAPFCLGYSCVRPFCFCFLLVGLLLFVL
jgi:hypothetical protein